jgi:ubiquitin-protein ligase
MSSKRLLQEFKNLERDKTRVVDDVCLSPHDNLYCWRAKMKEFDEETPDAKLLREDLKLLQKRFGGDGKIHMELNFTSKYPIEPPIIRVVLPRMRQYTGNITIGGAVCSEFLMEKYDPNFKVSEIMRMVRLNMLNAPVVTVTTQFGPGPRRAGPLRVDLDGRDHLGSPLREYSRASAESSLRRAYAHHKENGW